MPLYILILADLAVFYFFFGNYVNKYCRTAAGRIRFQLKECEKQFRAALLRDSDILPEESVALLREGIEEIHAARTGSDLEAAKSCLNKFSRESTLAKYLPPKKDGAWIRGHLEVLVVALGLAFGVRALFIQPFKIPTGSMQPTLYGIHFRSETEPTESNVISRFFSFLNFSRRAVDIVVKADGVMNWSSMRPASGMPFFPNCEFMVGKHFYRFPGSVEEARQMITEYLTRKAQQGPVHYEQGDMLLIYQRYDNRVDQVTVRQAGDLDWSTMTTTMNSDGRMVTKFVIAGNSYEVDLSPEDTKRIIIYYYAHPQGRGSILKKGDVLVRGYSESGDHLFVNRLSLIFREPRRGDPMVFMTTGLKSADGRSFGGSYYIKRLVGLPGDTLQIRGHKLYVKEKGAEDFRLLDGNDNIGFERMYSYKGDYHGYAHITPNPQLGMVGGGSMFLTSDDDTYEVPEGHYFMMGDNSENSWDSRWFGAVPRANLVGSPGFVWWPLSRRWGLPDRVDPDPELGDTPPNWP